MPVPSELNEGTINDFFNTWRSSPSLSTLGDMVQAVAVRAVRGAPAPDVNVNLAIAPTELTAEMKTEIEKQVKEAIEKTLGGHEPPPAGSRRSASKK